MTAAPVQRHDVAARLGKFARTGAGGVRVPATIARTGCQTYDGLVEYRPPEEVFAAASLETLPSIPVTKGHPTVPVTPANWRQLALGHVAETPAERARLDAAQEEWVKAHVVISDAELIAAIERGDVVEVSAGYSCRLDLTPGVAPDGTRYDAIQRDIKWNHLAVLDSTAGERARAGRDARLRLDRHGEPGRGEARRGRVGPGYHREYNNVATLKEMR